MSMSSSSRNCVQRIQTVGSLLEVLPREGLFLTDLGLGLLVVALVCFV
jgi:hypothetical protein